MEKTYLSIDIGGTDIKFGVLTENGQILEQGKIKTAASGDEIIQSIVIIKERLLASYPLCGVAFSLPGFVDVETGYLKTGGAIADFSDFQFKQQLTEKLALPVELENDVNCVALAEKWLGKAKDVQNFLCITIGTGIGGAIYINDQLVRGHRFMAGEFGYMFTKNVFATEHQPDATMNLSASVRDGLLRRYAQLKQLPSYAGISGKDLFTMAESGDKVAITVIDDFYKSIAIGLHNLTFILNPEKIIIGGAISQRKDLLPNIKRNLIEILKNQPVINRLDFEELVSIESSSFNNDNGLIGAVYHFMTMQNNRVK